MINFTLLPSHYLLVGRGSVCPLNGSLYYVCWVWGECSSGLGWEYPCNWTHGQVCACAYSHVCVRAWKSSQHVFCVDTRLCSYQ